MQGYDSMRFEDLPLSEAAQPRSRREGSDNVCRDRGHNVVSGDINQLILTAPQSALVHALPCTLLGQYEQHVLSEAPSST